MQQLNSDSNGIYAKIVDIKYLISSIFDIDSSYFDTNSRQADALLVRQLLQCMCKQVLMLNYTEIGKLMNCSHATVINSINKIQDRYDTEPKFREKYLILLSKCQEKFFDERQLAVDELENINSFFKNKIQKDSDAIYKKMNLAKSIIEKIDRLTNDLSNISQDIESEISKFSEKYDVK